MHESRLHEGKQADFPEPGESNSFRRAVRSIKSPVQKDGRRDENPDLIALPFSTVLTLDRAGRNSGAFFWFRCASWFVISL